MKKFILLSVIIVAFTVAIAVVIRMWSGGAGQQRTLAMDAIPMEASMLLKVNSFGAFADGLREHKLWRNMSRVYEIRHAASLAYMLDSLYASSSDIKRMLDANPLLVSICAVGQSHEWLAALQLPQGMGRAEVLAALRKLAPDCVAAQDQRYNQAYISVLELPDERCYYISAYHGVAMMASSKLLIERAVGQIDGGVSLVRSPQFGQILDMSGKNMPANLFVQYAQLPAVIKSAVGIKHRRGSQALADLALWTELDLSLSTDQIMASGLSNVADSANSFLRLLCAQRPVQPQLQQLLPAEVGVYMWWGISDQAEYLSQYRNYLERKREIHPYTQTLSKRKQQLGIQPEDLFSVLMKNQMTLAYWASIQADVPGCWYIVANTASPSAARKAIEKAYAAAQSNGVAPDGVACRTLQLERGQSLDVLRFPAPGLHRDVWGSMFDAAIDQYCCFIDNYIVYAPTPEALVRLAKAYHRNHTLGADVNYRNFAGETVKKANYGIYVNPIYASDIITEYTAAPATQLLISTAQQGLTGISVQLVGGSPYVFVALNMAQGKTVRTSTNQTQWISNLHARPIRCPQLVVNHNTREREVFVQDSAHNIYLISPQGRLLWERRIDGPITGEVQQVDAFRNGKLQLVFSTPTHIYLIDRLGRDVDGFPIALPAAATNPLTVVDYEGNRNYRLLQACADRHIYMYDVSGKPVEGWMFDRTETTVSHRIGLVRSEGKDYLVVFDRNRVYLLNRRGEERVAPSEHFSKSRHGQFGLTATATGQPCLVTTDSTGVVRTITLDGKVSSLALRPFSPHHTFALANISDEPQLDYLVLDEQHLSAFMAKGQPLFRVALPESMEHWIGVFEVEGKPRIGLASAQAGNIYMYGADGRMQETFPLQGATPFSVAKSKSEVDAYSLFVGISDGSVVCYSVK